MDNKFVLSHSFNEVVFENRNKRYGAYEIRRKYGRYAIIAAAALETDSELVTRNEQDFRGIQGLRVINPFAGR